MQVVDEPHDRTELAFCAQKVADRTLYLLLQLEQTALVIGAVALFVVLAAVMVLTRRIDWYARLAPAAASTPAT